MRFVPLLTGPKTQIHVNVDSVVTVKRKGKDETIKGITLPEQGIL